MFKSLKIFSVAAVSMALLLASCSSSPDKRGAKDATSALVNANKNIVSFGHANVDQILNKMDFRNVVLVKDIIGKNYDAWSKGIDFSKPVFYALEGPFDNEGGPAAMYALFDLKDNKALKDKLSADGYVLEKNGDIDWYQMDELSFGIRNQLAVILIKQGSYNGKDEIQAVFKTTEADLSEGKTAEILDKSGDIVLGLSIERLYLSANSAANKLPDARRKELEAMATNSYLQTVIDFNKGNMTAKTDHLFSDPLMAALPFSEKKSNVVNKLGGGTPWMGFSTNFDMSKFDSFINTYAPEIRKSIIERHPDAKAAMMLLGDNAFEQLFNGQTGFVAVGSVQEGSVPEFNAYVGLGSQGDILSGLVKTQLIYQGIPGNGSTFNLFGEELTVSPNELRIVSDQHKKGALKVPAFAKGFGSKTFSFFMNMENMDLSTFDLEPEQQFLTLIKQVYIVSDKNNTELVVVAKDGSTNILKQIAQFYADMAQGKLSGI